MPETTAVLKSLCAKRDLWLRTSRRLDLTYWVIGILGLTMSALAAANLPKISSPYFSLIATICFGIIGFANPQKLSVKNIQAYLIIDQAIFRYNVGLITIAKLYDELARAEDAVHGNNIPQPATPGAVAIQPGASPAPVTTTLKQ